MTQSLVLAALVTTIVAITHSWLGEVRLIGPLLSPEHRIGVLAHRYARLILRFAWHITSLAWICIAGILLTLSSVPLDRTGRMILACIAVTFLISGLISLIISRGRHLGWPLLLAVAAFSTAPLL